jgi:lysophospholipase L1-like esterase
LDGIRPSALGHELIADRVAAALNDKYGWAIPIPPRPL